MVSIRVSNSLRISSILVTLAILSACQSYKDGTDWKAVTQYVKEQK